MFSWMLGWLAICMIAWEEMTVRVGAGTQEADEALENGGFVC